MLLITLLPFTFLFKGYYCIIGGYTAYTGAFPYHASIFYEGEYRCGGALIGNSWIVTVASCVEGENDQKVLLGSTNLQSHDVKSKLLDVKCVVIHPEYIGGYDNNIALLALESSITPDFNTMAIDLATHNPPPGEAVIITGFGKTSAFRQHSKTLQSVTTNIITNESCKVSYMFLFVNVMNNEFCTGGSLRLPKGACPGDEGSPLVTLHGFPELVGIVNIATHLCSGTLPTIYTSIAQYRDWILANQRCLRYPHKILQKSKLSDGNITESQE